MDRIVIIAIKAAVTMLGLDEHIAVTAIDAQDTVWIRDDRTTVGARWVLVENSTHFLTIHNGRSLQYKIDLSDPESIKDLAKAIDDALMTTRMFLPDED